MNLSDRIIKKLANRRNKIQTCFENFYEIQTQIELILGSHEANENDMLAFEDIYFFNEL